MPGKQQFEKVTTKRLKVLPGGSVEGVFLELGPSDPVPPGTPAGTYIFRRQA